MQRRKNDLENNYLNRYFEDCYSLEDSERFFKAIREDKDKEAIDTHASKIWNLALQVTTPTQVEEKISYSEVNLILKEKKENLIIRKLWKIASVAASIIFISGLLFGGFRYISSLKSHEHAYISVMTSTGETKSVVLPDGSTVTLNSSSQIAYPEKFENNRRTVELVGEAYFQVVKNDNSPFVIKTHEFNVKVLGTDFNVRAYIDAEIHSVSVHSGKVQVDMPEAMMQLTANEVIQINSQDQTYFKERNERNVAVWRTGRLQFYKTPIREVAKELERNYGYRIYFKADQTFDNLITGEHSSSDLISLLTSIASITGIQYSINENEKEILFFKK